MTTKRRVLFLTLHYVCAALFLVLLSSSEWLRYGRYAKLAVETKAAVVDLHAGSHQAIAYQYAVESQTYRRVGCTGYGNPNYYDLKLGDSIRVWYLPDNRMASIATEPAAEQRNNATIWLIGPVWFALPYSYLIWRELKRRREEDAIGGENGGGTRI